MNSEQIQIGLTIVNVIISPLIIYFFNSINTKIKSVEEKIGKLDDKLEDFGNRVTKIETTCSIRHSK